MLKNMKIVHKICALVVLVSFVGIAASVYASYQLQAADDRYNEMIERLDKSTLYLARLNRSANSIGFNAYRTIVYDAASPEAADAAKVAAEQSKKMVEFYGDVASRLTDRTDKLQPIKAAMDQIHFQTDQAIKLGLANQNEAATEIMRQVDPIIVQMTALTSSLNDETIKRVTETSADLSASADRTSVLLIAGTIAAAAIGLVLSMLVAAKGITGPLQLLRLRMSELAGGRLDVDVEGQERGDEVGAMAKAVQVFKDAANENKRLEAEAEAGRMAQAANRDRQAAVDNAKAEDLKIFVHAVEAGFDKLSSGDLTVRMTQAVAPEFEPIRAKFNDSVAQLENTIGSVVGAVGTMRVGLNQITVAAGDLSQRTEQQAASLEETVAALGEVVRGVNQTAQSAEDARAAAALAQMEAEKGGGVVSQAVAAMSEIEESSNKIGSIISVIDEIAFQTNLLALNAGVEAARAGEAGRGFAVVAQEVRGLAQRSAEAAKEIKDLISTSGAQVAHGVEFVSASGRSLEQIVAQVGGVTMMISQMAQGAREQSVALKEVSIAADQMDKVTQQNAAMVEETTAAAQSLSAETEQLAGLVDGFRTASGQRADVRPSGRAALRAGSSSARPVTQMRTTGVGGAAPKAALENESWEEF